MAAARSSSNRLADIQAVCQFRYFLSNPLGTLYRTPATRLPMAVMRHFDSALSAAMLPAYVDLIQTVGE